MGAGGMYPNGPYSYDYPDYNHPYYNQGGYHPPNHVPPYGYPTTHIPHHSYPQSQLPPYAYPSNYGMGYGRGYQRPYYPSINGVFPNPMLGRGFLSAPRTGAGGLQSAPPSATPNGNIQLHRPGEHRPHFDEH